MSLLCQGSKGQSQTIALKRLSCRDLSRFFLQCHISQSGYFWNALLRVPPRSPPGPADLWFPILMFTSWSRQVYAKSSPGMELARGSAYNSARAQGNLYATQPAHPPLLAQAKNSQWSCSGRNPTLSLGALSQEKREQSWRPMHEAKPQSPKLQSQRAWLSSTTSLVPPQGLA